MALAAKYLSCERHERLLFQNIIVTIAAGGLLHISGKNGVGKTTLLKILAGLLTPSQGSVTWEGIPISACRLNFYQQLCYIGHHNALNLQLTATENLHFITKSYATKTTVQAALQHWHMAPYATLATHYLSAGQRRRIALAKLCLRKASLWLLDEPYTALDKEAIEVLNHLLASQVAQGGMVIITSHQAITIPTVTVQHLVLS